jgi:glycine cleavage system transcriptional repressor
MQKWFMLTVIGRDRPGIVAQVTHALFKGGCHLGEASMIRLGGNFTIMMMAHHRGTAASLYEQLREVVDALELTVHVDEIEGGLHEHVEPDVFVTVHGADRAGIVAQVTGVLAEAGLNILDLESDVAGTEDAPIYVMRIEGRAEKGVEVLEAAVRSLRDTDIEVRLTPVETMIG